jgi:ApaG protein
MNDAHRVEVNAESFYLPEHSAPDEGRYAFGYNITITNHGDVAVQLLERHWLITDGLGRVQEVRGKGVIGEQPVIEPGAQYAYSSFCPLTTPHGFMQGHYTMLDTTTGQRFEAEVPMFVLGSLPKRELN